jgi:very-short-patch-repair endonuclease
VAARQEGVVSRSQLIALGYSDRAISYHAAAGRLHRVYPGVYAVGHRALSERGQLLAAVIACHSGPGSAALSHRSAGRLHGILRSSGAADSIDVTATARRRLAAIRWHRARRLHPNDLTTVGAIPVTTVARTLLDVAEVLHPQRLHDALEQTLRLDAFDVTAIQATIARNPGRHGIKPLTEALTRLPDVAPALWSWLEVDLARLLRTSDLPAPASDVVVEGEPVDFLWSGPRVIVESDGDRYHRLASDRIADARRDRKLALAGYTVLRVSDVELNADPARVIADIRAILASAPPAG